MLGQHENIYAMDRETKTGRKANTKVYSGGLYCNLLILIAEEAITAEIVPVEFRNGERNGFFLQRPGHGLYNTDTVCANCRARTCHPERINIDDDHEIIIPG